MMTCGKAIGRPMMNLGPVLGRPMSQDPEFGMDSEDLKHAVHALSLVVNCSSLI